MRFTQDGGYLHGCTCNCPHIQPAPGKGGGKFCPPLIFFEDIKKTNRFILTSFSVPTCLKMNGASSEENKLKIDW